MPTIIGFATATPQEIDGLPTKNGDGFHGNVSHNQMVN
jgi:hypothetical protein